jgi:hypothetical protein
VAVEPLRLGLEQVCGQDDQSALSAPRMTSLLSWPGQRRPTQSRATATITTAKRDWLTAELERGSSPSQLGTCLCCSYSHARTTTHPQLSTVARELNTTHSQVALERELAAAETTRLELETLLRDR